MRELQRPEEIGLQRVAIGVELRIEEARSARIDHDAGVVHEHVDAAAPLGNGGNAGADAAAARHVEALKLDPQACVLQRLRCRFALSGIARGQHDREAVPRELTTDLETDAAVAAAHQRDARGYRAAAVMLVQPFFFAGAGTLMPTMSSGLTHASN